MTVKRCRHINVCVYLSGVLVGRGDGAVRVGGVQTRPVHVAVPHVRLLQHLLEAFHVEVGPAQVLQELLRVEVGPLQRVFTSVMGKGNKFIQSCSFPLVKQAASPLVNEWE